MSHPESAEESDLELYVKKFQEEVERKFFTSQANGQYVFPKKKLIISPKAQRMSMSPPTYDLHYSDVKRQIKRLQKDSDSSIYQRFVRLIKLLGVLNEDYLTALFQKSNFLFQVIQEETKRLSGFYNSYQQL